MLNDCTKIHVMQSNTRTHTILQWELHCSKDLWVCNQCYIYTPITAFLFNGMETSAKLNCTVLYKECMPDYILHGEINITYNS